MPRTTRDPDLPLSALSGVHGGVHVHAKDLRILQNILADPPSSIFTDLSAGIRSLAHRDTAEMIFCAAQNQVGPVLVDYPFPDMALDVSTYLSQPYMYTCTLRAALLTAGRGYEHHRTPPHQLQSEDIAAGTINSPKSILRIQDRLCSSHARVSAGLSRSMLQCHLTITI